MTKIFIFSPQKGQGSIATEEIDIDFAAELEVAAGKYPQIDGKLRTNTCFIDTN